MQLFYLIPTHYNLTYLQGSPVGSSASPLNTKSVYYIAYFDHKVIIQ